MIWAGFLLVVGLFSDWPWLWAVFALGLSVHFGHWHRDPLLLGATAVGVVSVEAVLTTLRRRIPTPDAGFGLWGQCAVLLATSVSLGALLGILSWHLTVGTEAAHRLPHWFRRMKVLMGFRLIRFAAGIGVVWLFAQNLGGW